MKRKPNKREKARIVREPMSSLFLQRLKFLSVWKNMSEDALPWAFALNNEWQREKKDAGWVKSVYLDELIPRGWMAEEKKLGVMRLLGYRYVNVKNTGDKIEAALKEAVFDADEQEEFIGGMKGRAKARRERMAEERKKAREAAALVPVASERDLLLAEFGVPDKDSVS